MTDHDAAKAASQDEFLAIANEALRILHWSLAQTEAAAVQGNARTEVYASIGKIAVLIHDYTKECKP